MSHKCQSPNPESQSAKLRALKLPVPPALALAARYSRRVRQLHKDGVGHLEAARWMAYERELGKLMGLQTERP